MQEIKPKFAFFDVDHTITRHSTGRRYVEYGYSRGLFRFSELLGLPFFYLRYRLGSVSLSDLSRDMAPVAGKQREDVEKLAAECYHRAIVPDIYAEAEELIARLVEEGVSVGIATSSLDILVAPLAERLKIELVLATSLEYKENATTGQTSGLPCFGVEKRRRALAHLETIGISPEECAFYSDSRYDLPLLEAVGVPIVVNPDRPLRRVARARGWAIQYFRT